MDISDLKNQLERIGSVSVKRDEEGRVEVKNPQKRYSRSAEKDLHPDGEGPFCEFNFRTSKYEETEGVFLFAIGDNVKYVGESSNISKYIYDIGNISPSVCYEGGQQTVCRINTKILHAARNGKEVTVWATKSSSSNELKEQLVKNCSPTWNLR